MLARVEDFSDAQVGGQNPPASVSEWRSEVLPRQSVQDLGIVFEGL